MQYHTFNGCENDLHRHHMANVPPNIILDRLKCK